MYQRRVQLNNNNNSQKNIRCYFLFYTSIRIWERKLMQWHSTCIWKLVFQKNSDDPLKKFFLVVLGLLCIVQTSLVLVCRLSSCLSRDVCGSQLPDRGSDLCLLPWMTVCSPLDHQGSPKSNDVPIANWWNLTSKFFSAPLASIWIIQFFGEIFETSVVSSCCRREPQKRIQRDHRHFWETAIPKNTGHSSVQSQWAV